MRKLTTAFLALALVLTGCAGTAEPPPEPSLTESSTVWASGFSADATIGVTLPQKTSESWVPAEGMFKDGLKDAGFTPMVLFADGGVTAQQRQILDMAEAGVKVIIVGSMDASSLGEQLASAKQAGVIIIAYDRLLTNTPDVDMFIGYDNCMVGTLQGTALLEGLDSQGEGPYNIELIAGSPDDQWAAVFFDCAMEVLQPKIDDGTLKIPSGQTTLQQVYTDGWWPVNATKRFDVILSNFYSGGEQLDGILSPNDYIARAVIDTVEEAGFGIPVVTGQDSEEESVRWIASGKQYSTIHKDTATLISETINLVKQLQQGLEIAFTDTTTYNNGVKIVPAYLLPPLLVTKDNVCTAYDPGMWPGKAAAETPLCRGE